MNTLIYILSAIYGLSLIAHVGTLLLVGTCLALDFEAAKKHKFVKDSIRLVISLPITAVTFYVLYSFWP